MLGEFLRSDPRMSNPSGHAINAFAYVENQPLDRVDPSGFDDLPKGVADFCRGSGKPKIHSVDMASKKAAREAAEEAWVWSAYASSVADQGRSALPSHR